MLFASEYRGLYVVSDNDGDTHLEKVAGATRLNSERLECIIRTSLNAHLRGLMQWSIMSPLC